MNTLALERDVWREETEGRHNSSRKKIMRQRGNLTLEKKCERKQREILTQKKKKNAI